MMGLQFATPWALLLILPLFALGFFLWWQRQRRHPSLKMSSLKMIKQGGSSWRAQWTHLPEVLKWTALLLCLIALARPQKADTLIKKNVEGIDIMIVLDISDSMLVEDMAPLNRLETAKETIQNFVKARSSDRIGVVVFAGESFTLVPLTLDYELLLERIKEITTAQQARIKDGTAIGVALANAAGRLRESTAKSRVMIFLTDGENNRGTIDPLTALEIAKGYDQKIYSIGIGRDGPTRIPVFTQDAFGNRFKTYQPFESYVNDKLLQQMADDTGGKYYRASEESGLKKVFDEINQLETTKIDINKYTRYTELFENWLLLAIVLYSSGSVLGFTILRRLP